MSWMNRFRNIFRNDRLHRDIRREMEFHLAEHADELRAAGLTETDALREASRRFGNTTYQGERTRDADVVTWLESAIGDLRYAGRSLRRAPVFAMVAVASLAIAIGANTSIYTLIDAVVLRALPVPNADELVQVKAGALDESGYFTNPLWEEIRDRQSGLAAVTAFSETSLNLSATGEVRRIGGSWVSGDYFRVFGVKPALGRVISRADDFRGCPGIAVLGNGFWQREYGASTDVVGRRILLEGKPFQIVGVAAAGFRGVEVGRENQVYVPLCSEAYLRGPANSLDARSIWWLRIVGRRDPALGVDAVSDRLGAIAPAAYGATIPMRRAKEAQLEYSRRTLNAESAPQGFSALRTQYTKALALLMGGVALVLLIACANIANLLLARSEARGREVAIRLAVGAARSRLVRQLLTESALLAVIGCAAGLVLARWATAALVALIGGDTDPIALDLSLNWRVLAFTAASAAITAMVFGLIPAVRGTRVGPHTALKAGGRGVASGGGHARFTIGKALVALQVALSLVLLAGAGLLVGSLRNLTSVDPGFRPDGVLIANVNLRGAALPAEQRAAVRDEMLARLRALPGVRSASRTSVTPASGSSWNGEVAVDGFRPANEKDDLSWFNEVSADYFTTMETRLLAGRDFDATDRPGSPTTAIVNEAMVRRFFGTGAAFPLGKQYRTKIGDTLSDPVTIVGVVENAKYNSLREADAPIVYLPDSRDPSPPGGTTFLIGGSGDPAALVPAVKSALLQLQPLASLEFTPLTRQLASSLSRERLLAILSALFGAIALLLSMIGLYGVMAYSVARRRNEIGVRIALGAERGRVLRLVLADVTRVVVIGTAFGIGGAWFLGKLVESFLYGLEPREPAVLVLAAIVLAVVAIGAGFGPAWRASRLDPVEALREE